MMAAVKQQVPAGAVGKGEKEADLVMGVSCLCWLRAGFLLSIFYV